MTKLVKKSVKTTKSVPVVEEPVSVVETVVEQTTNVNPETTNVEEAQVCVNNFADRVKELLSVKATQINQLKSEVVELKALLKLHETEVKVALKTKKARRKTDTPRKPSGFSAPSVVSDEMYAFLSKFGVDKTQPIARTEVTKYIHRYIKENNLQNAEHKREINPDKTLQTLLGAPQEDSVSGNGKCYNFLRLQSYMSKHFPKKVAA